MADEDSLLNALEEALPHIDERLASEGSALDGRATRAALMFARLFITGVRSGEGDPVPPGSVSEMLASDWFRILYRHVERWYRDLYGRALDRSRADAVAAVILIRGTPFQMSVPLAVRERGENGTVWVGFPADVLPEEDALLWITDPPNMDKLDDKDRSKLRKLASEIAGQLRRVRNTLMSVQQGSDQFEGLKAGILPRLERAATLIASHRPEMVQQAYWELQLAGEHALKLLQLQRTGDFTETHDLFVLYDRAGQPPPAFTRDTLKGLPNWETMAALRYGQGSHDDVADVFVAYRKALKVVSGAVSSLEHQSLHEARFQIQAPPWMRD